MVIERRLHMREDLALPLKLDDNSSGLTRNLSASGLYLEIVGMYRPEGPVVFELETGRLKFTAQGDVVRLDYGRSKTGVAIKFAFDRLKAID
jgi:hypothetical protein